MPPLVPGAITARLMAADAGTTVEKGDALEAVVGDTFCLFNGVGILFKNAVDVDNSCEIDILLYNQRHPQGLPFLPEHILIECKNWHGPVNTAAVRAFTSKLRDFQLDFGILVAANGITGDAAEQTAAHAHLRREFDQLRMKVIVVTRIELEALASTEALGMLLRQRYGAFIMGLQGL